MTYPAVNSLMSYDEWESMLLSIEMAQGERMPEYSQRELVERMNKRVKGQVKLNRKQRRAAKARKR